MTNKLIHAHSEDFVNAKIAKRNEGVEHKKSPFEISNRDEAKRLFARLNQRERDEMLLGILFAFADGSLKAVG